MRIAPKPTEQEIIEGPQAVSFLIANGNVRQRCILQTEFPTKAFGPEVSSDELACYRAADGARGSRDGNLSLEDGQIKLVA